MLFFPCNIYGADNKNVNFIYSEIWYQEELIMLFGKYISYPSQDSSIGSISAWYRGGPGSNPGKGENFSVKISNWIVRI